MLDPAPLYRRTTGQTTLLVYAGEGTSPLHRMLGRDSDLTGYVVVAAATRSRPTSYLATLTTLYAAQQYVDTYELRFGLL